MNAFVVCFLAAAALAAPVDVTLSSFSFTDCGPTNAPLHFPSLSITPDPIVRPFPPHCLRVLGPLKHPACTDVSGPDHGPG